MHQPLLQNIVEVQTKTPIRELSDPLATMVAVASVAKVVMAVIIPAASEIPASVTKAIMERVTAKITETTDPLALTEPLALNIVKVHIPLALKRPLEVIPLQAK